MSNFVFFLATSMGNLKNKTKNIQKVIYIKRNDSKCDRKKLLKEGLLKVTIERNLREREDTGEWLISHNESESENYHHHQFKQMHISDTFT